MPALTPANTVSEWAALDEPSIVSTCEQMIREQAPNLFRLFINPYVAQACYCLSRYVSESWPQSTAAEAYQVFLANSEEEALSGAIKLARYGLNRNGSSPAGLIVDEHSRFDHFAYSELAGPQRVTYIPEIEVVDDPHRAARVLGEQNPMPGFVVVSHELLRSTDNPIAGICPNRTGNRRQPLLVTYTDREQLASHEPIRNCCPDILVFDESLANAAVPFGAFAASKRLYRYWNRRGMATFHSTTYQPNTVSSLHLLRCLHRFDPEFLARHERALVRIEKDVAYRNRVFSELYSKPLARLATIAGFGRDVRAQGHYVSLPGRRVFDGVAGVACSIRGHHPSEYLEELEECGDLGVARSELTDRLHMLTGLPQMVPAVSGAAAVEQALKMSLASQHPRDYVLALRGGFGGKTLCALTGTWKPALKSGLMPLYPNVIYVDPFAADATNEIDAVFRDFPIGVVQLELIQAVGGVRTVPQSVVRRLADKCRENDCLLFVDEVQTGMFRTGPFVRSTEEDIRPDLMTIGKGTSDMMFPFAMTFYSDRIEQQLRERGCTIPDVMTARYGYEIGYRTVLNTLRRADEHNLADQVRERGHQFSQLLGDQLTTCRLVRDVRCFGLLIGIELDVMRFSHGWLNKLVSQLSLLSMLHHPTFPLLVGFCQYEPHVLKLTPPLSVTEDEVHSICGTISDVLHHPLRPSVVAAAAKALIRK